MLPDSIAPEQYEADYDHGNDGDDVRDKKKQDGLRIGCFASFHASVSLSLLCAFPWTSLLYPFALRLPRLFTRENLPANFDRLRNVHGEHHAVRGQSVFRLDQRVEQRVGDDRGDQQRERAAVEQLAALVDVCDASAEHRGARAVHARRAEAAYERPEDRHPGQAAHQDHHVLQHREAQAHAKGDGQQRVAVVGEIQRVEQHRHTLQNLLDDRRDVAADITRVAAEEAQQQAVDLRRDQADHHAQQHKAQEQLGTFVGDHVERGAHRHADAQKQYDRQVCHFFTPLSIAGTSASETPHRPTPDRMNRIFEPHASEISSHMLSTDKAIASAL